MHSDCFRRWTESFTNNFTVITTTLAHYVIPLWSTLTSTEQQPTSVGWWYAASCLCPGSLLQQPGWRGEARAQALQQPTETGEPGPRHRASVPRHDDGGHLRAGARFYFIFLTFFILFFFLNPQRHNSWPLRPVFASEWRDGMGLSATRPKMCHVAHGTKAVHRAADTWSSLLAWCIGQLRCVDTWRPEAQHLSGFSNDALTFPVSPQSLPS